MSFDYDACHTYADGTIIEKPDPWFLPLDRAPTIEERIAVMRARNAYHDKVTDMANRAFADQFRKALKANS